MQSSLCVRERSALLRTGQLYLRSEPSSFLGGEHTISQLVCGAVVAVWG